MSIHDVNSYELVYMYYCTTVCMCVCMHLHVEFISAISYYEWEDILNSWHDSMVSGCFHTILSHVLEACQIHLKWNTSSCWKGSCTSKRWHHSTVLSLVPAFLWWMTQLVPLCTGQKQPIPQWLFLCHQRQVARKWVCTCWSQLREMWPTSAKCSHLPRHPLPVLHCSCVWRCVERNLAFGTQ